MEYRTLGGTGVRVSELCFGAMMFGGWGNTDEDECIRMLHRALDGGINFVDTADVYSEGRSEEIVGRALAGKRDQVVLATKVHGEMGEVTDLVAQGKIRYAGCSTFPAWMIVESHRVAERRGYVRFRSEQPPYSIFVRQIELDVLPVAQRYGMGVISWSPLAGGWLTGKYRRGQDVPGGSRAERFRGRPVWTRFDPDRPGNQRKFDLVEELDKIASNAGVSMTHMAHAFVLNHPAITSAIIGPRTMEQLEDALASADVRLDEATLDAIDAVVPPGTVLEDFDRGWTPPWLEPQARRRR